MAVPLRGGAFLQTRLRAGFVAFGRRRRGARRALRDFDVDWRAAAFMRAIRVRGIRRLARA